MSGALKRCRVDGCRNIVETLSDASFAQHGFCPSHKHAAPAPFVDRWERARSMGELFRLWEQLADDFAFQAPAAHVFARARS